MRIWDEVQDRAKFQWRVSGIANLTPLKKPWNNEMENTCNRYKWWNNGGIQSGYEECRYRSPVLILDDETKRYKTIWPYTYDDDWCGDFEPNAG
jgi:hypothetical protein